MSSETTNGTTNLSTADHGQTTSTNERKFTLQDVPCLPREITPFALFTTVVEMDQRGPLFQGPGAKRETGRYKIRPEDESNVKLAKKFAMEQSVKFVMLKQQQNQQRAQLEIIKKQQALLLMCRTYIGSINFELNETMLKQAFQPFGPVKSVSLTFDPVTNRHKGFAFLEYETPEAAQLSIEQMNGVVLGGRNIKVGRPSNMPQAQPIIDQLTEEAKNYNRIYVASIHPDLTENDIKSVFEAFGIIKSCVLAKDTTTGKHKGYGFIEYETAQASKDAISAMNLFDLGGQNLRVGKAITPPDGVSATVQSPAAQMPVATTIAAQTISAQFHGKELEAINSSIGGNSFNPLSSVDYARTSVISPTNAHFNNPVAAAVPAAISSASATSGFTSGFAQNVPGSRANTGFDSMTMQKSNSQTIPPPPQLIVPPVPSGIIPQPTLLEEPPVPVGLRNEIDQQQSYPSISLNLPTKTSSSTTETKEKSTLPVSNSEETAVTLSQQEELSVKGREQRHLLMQKLNQRLLGSRICILRNMIAADQVDDYLEQEIKAECSKYGSVSQVIIYVEKQTEDEIGPEIVKIFVQFEDSKGVEKACQSLNGRWFGGRKIQAEVYDEAAFEAQDFSG